MKHALRALVVAAALVAAATGCGKGWQMDYGKPAAQFVQEDVVAKGRPFIDKKVTIRGTVARVDVSTTGDAKLYLENNITCKLGGFEAMAKSRKVGDTVFVDGFLVRCEAAEVVLEPAMLRDPTAAFNPM